jgi:hypothetical protein
MAFRSRIRSHDDLLAELARARRAKGLSRSGLDERAGLPPGFTESLELGAGRFGKDGFNKIASALGIEFQLVRTKTSTHRAECPENIDDEQARAKKDFHVKRARKGGFARHGRRTSEERTKMASQIAHIRWRKWRELKAMKAAKEQRGAKGSSKPK